MVFWQLSLEFFVLLKAPMITLSAIGKWTNLKRWRNGDARTAVRFRQDWRSLSGLAVANAGSTPAQMILSKVFFEISVR